MAEPANVKLSFTVDELLTLVDEHLHGHKSAFSEVQKIDHINKAMHAVWKALKITQRGYFVLPSQPTVSTQDDYFPAVDATNTVYLLPKNFAELEFIENTTANNTAKEYRHAALTSELFKGARRTGTTDSNLWYYDLIGPDSAGRQSIVFDRAPGVFTLKLWYVRFLPQFSVPKVAGETLVAILAPYVFDLVNYAVQSLLRSESADVSQVWQEQWTDSIQATAIAASTRQSAEPQERPAHIPPGGSPVK